MTERTLRDRQILLVEDEYLLAEEIRNELEDAGAIVLGPSATLEDAIALIEAQSSIDAAILDASLGGVMVFPAADELAQRNIPFIFTTGYDASSLPSRFSDVPQCGKPISIRTMMQTIGRILDSGPA